MPHPPVAPRAISVAAALGLTAFQQLPAQRPSPPSRANVIHRAIQATVSLEAIAGSDTAIGSGVIVSPLGIIATAAHVVDGAIRIRVHGAAVPVTEVIGVYTIDRRYDFALLRIATADAPTLRLGNSDSVTVGERVLAVGSPLGLEATVTDGLVSAEREDGERRLLQISIPVSPGSSGGPVLTEEGRVVGLVVSGIRGGGVENLNFALPINYVRRALGTTVATDPVPLVDAVTVTLGERRNAAGPVLAPAPAGGGARGAARPSSVNDSLALDWGALDSVSVYSEDNDHTRTWSSTIRYTRTRDAAGAPVLERYVTGVWNQGYQDLYRDDYRIVLYPTGDSHEYYRRTSFDDRARAFAWEAAVEHGVWHVTVEGGRTGTAALPVGILPPQLQGGAVAALPESLPAVVFIWFIAWDSTLSAHAAPARFEFGRRESMKVPVAANGQACEPETPVTDWTVPVVWVTETVEAGKFVYPVLAKHPHLRIDPESTKCLSAPFFARSP